MDLQISQLNRLEVLLIVNWLHSRSKLSEIDTWSASNFSFNASKQKLHTPILIPIENIPPVYNFKGHIIKITSMSIIYNFVAIEAVTKKGIKMENSL